MAGTEFADLSRDPAPVEIGGRVWSPANLVAAVARGLRDAAGPAEGAVVTYPAVYSDKQVALLRQALDLSGAREILLAPEPVAAAEWLEFEQGPLDTGFVLVYDLGGNSLDVTVVRVGPDWTDHPIVGKPMRAHEYGGRPLGAIIARHARSFAPDGMASALPARDIRDLRVAHIRRSFGLVRSCVRASGRGFADIDRVLVVGGAARPVEVAETLTELGRPVVMSADPGQCSAAGAAHFAARIFAPAETEGRAPRTAVFSSAAVASALAMSAVTVFGGSMEQGVSPFLEFLPGGDVLADNTLYDPSGDSTLDRLVRQGIPLPRTPRSLGGLDQLVASAKPLVPMGPSIEESRGGHRPDPRTLVRHGMLYANPATFVNPLPFHLPKQQPPEEESGHTNSGKPISEHESKVPEVSLPASRDKESGGQSAAHSSEGSAGQADSVDSAPGGEGSGGASNKGSASSSGTGGGGTGGGDDSGGGHGGESGGPGAADGNHAGGTDTDGTGTSGGAPSGGTGAAGGSTPGRSGDGTGGGPTSGASGGGAAPGGAPNQSATGGPSGRGGGAPGAGATPGGASGNSVKPGGAPGGKPSGGLGGGAGGGGKIGGGSPGGGMGAGGMGGARGK
nr:Hsp70 family protein [Nocardia bovistercoris]